MGERPILMKPEMVRAILRGEKTQTRRLVKPPPDEGLRPGHMWFSRNGERSGVVFCRHSVDFERCDERDEVRSPYGAPGDRLWVRETFYERVYQEEVGDSGDYFVLRHTRQAHYADQGIPPVLGDNAWDYKSNVNEDGSAKDFLVARGRSWWRKVSSIHMPRWASRITLEVTDVRVERLQDISEGDARAEGCRRGSGACGQVVGMGPPQSAREAFERLWRSINGADSWDANPWVWVVSFKRAERGEAEGG